MDNEKKSPDRPEAQQPVPEEATENEWFDDILESPVTGKEIGEDEHVESIGLTPFSEQELEKIIQEALSEDWMSTEDEAELPQTQEEFRDEEFRNTFGNNDILNPAYYTDNGELPEEEPEVGDAPALEEPELEESEKEEPGKLPRKVRPKRTFFHSRTQSVRDGRWSPPPKNSPQKIWMIDFFTYLCSVLIQQYTHTL